MVFTKLLLENALSIRPCNVSINSKPDHPPGRAPGYSHILARCPCGRVFAPLSCPGGLKSKSKFDNFEKSVIFALSLKQMCSSSFHMFIYARSGQCDLIEGPAYLLII